MLHLGETGNATCLADFPDPFLDKAFSEKRGVPGRGGTGGTTSHSNR